MAANTHIRAEGLAVIQAIEARLLLLEDYKEALAQRLREDEDPHNAMGSAWNLLNSTNSVLPEVRRYVKP